MDAGTVTLSAQSGEEKASSKKNKQEYLIC